MDKKKLPKGVVARISLYRQELAKYQYASLPHIFSADMARALNLKEEIVRRDLMLIGCKATGPRRGFSISVIIEKINHALNLPNDIVANIAIIGNNACINDIILNNYSHLKIKIAAVFDYDITKVADKEEFTYYPFSMINEVIKNKNILLAVLNLFDDNAQQICDILINAGIKGIINLTPNRIYVPSHIYLDQINQITVLDKAVYNIKMNQAKKNKY
jgi:redox-sensing transcriptional repressor